MVVYFANAILKDQFKNNLESDSSHLTYDMGFMHLYVQTISNFVSTEIQFSEKLVWSIRKTGFSV